MKNVAIALLLLFVTTQLQAVELYTDFPAEIKPDERYVIYSHGYILEGNVERPQHPKFGIYEYPKVKQALFNNGGYNLIAHHRPANTDIDEYVSRLENWVRRLTSAGVKPSKITLVGFSRGGHLTAMASNKLRALNINTALLAPCWEGDIRSEMPLNIGGNLLSIFETSDRMGNCSILAEHSPALESFREIAISTGLSHGAFFQPLDEWVLPLKAWINETNN